MTDFHVECFRVGKIEKHPNADTLGITHVGGYPVICRLGDYSTGDLAVYVPVDSVVPTDDPRWAFLEGKGRIKAKKLRGIFSQGLITPAEPGMQEGDDVAEALGITKYLTPEEQNELGTALNANGNQTKRSLNVAPSYLPRYTSVENLKRHPNAFNSSDNVVVTDKIEGENAGFAYNNHTLWQRLKSKLGFSVPYQVICRSRNELKTSGKWFDIISKYNLKERFERLEDPEAYSIYGESYGYTPGFDYGTDRSGAFVVFDVWDRYMNCWLDWDDVCAVAEAMGLRTVPVLYEGPFDRDIMDKLANRETATLGNPTHIPEGIIIRSEFEQDKPGVGRLLLKHKGERYLLSRK